MQAPYPLFIKHISMYLLNYKQGEMIKYKYAPFKKKKYVVRKSESEGKQMLE